MPDIPAILFGEAITALGTLRSLGKAGISAYLVNDHPEYVASSRWYRRMPAAGIAAPPPEKLGDFLSSLGLAKAVLIPCSDHWSHAVASLGADYSDRFPSSLPPVEVLDLLIDKWLFAQVLDREGVPHPHTCLLTSPMDLDRVPDQQMESAFLKPCDSHAFFQAYAVKGYMLAGRESAKKQLSKVLADGFAVMLQDYIPGPQTAHYFIDGYARGDGSTAALFARRRLRMYPPDFGNSTYMVSVPLEEVRDAADSLVRFWPRIGYRGIFSAEFKRDSRDGVLKLIEINPRPWWYIEFATLCGVNVVEMAYREALGLPVKSVEYYAVGRRAFFLYEDWLALRDLRLRKKLKVKDWLRSCLGSHEMTFSWRDPIPSFVYIGSHLHGFVRTRLSL